MSDPGGVEEDLTRNSRGFVRFGPVRGHFANGEVITGAIEVGESSCAFPASIHVWATEENDKGNVTASVQLDLEMTVKLRDQLTWLIENHYQNDGG
jgi:hypothetical protein